MNCKMNVAVGLLAVFTCFCVHGTNAQGTAYEIAFISNDTTIKEGASTELVCSVFYQRDATISITWLREEMPVMNSSDSIILEQDIVRAGWQFRILYLQLCNVTRSFIYTCSVSNETGTKQDTVILAVEFNQRAFEVVTITEDTEASSGESVVLRCIVFYQRFANISSIKWSKDDGELSNSTSVTITERDEELGGRSFRHSLLYLCNLEESESGNYTCSVSNGVVTKFEKVELSVIRNASFDESAFEVVTISENTEASSGGSVGLICTVFYQRFANISSIKWSKDDGELSNSTSMTITERDEELGGRSFRHSLLYLCNLEESDSGNYTCSVSNGVVTRFEKVELSVVRNASYDAFEIVAISNFTQVGSGESIGLSCVIFYQRHVSISSVVWSKDDEEISNSSWITIFEIDQAIGGRFFRQSMLYLCSLNMSNSGNYTCSVSDGIQQRQEKVELFVDESIIFSGRVNDILVSPDVIRVGQDVVLNCEASVNSSSNITWTHDGKDIMNSSSSLIMEDYGINNGIAHKTSTLQFRDVQCPHSGQYVCSVSTDSSSTVLTVTGNIMVDLSPKDIEADLGENLTFVCTINGQLDGDVSVTWSSNNEEIWSTQEKFVKGKTLYVRENITVEEEGVITCSVQQNSCSSSSSVKVSLKSERNITAPSGLSRGAAAGVAVAATAVTVATVSAGVVAVKVAFSAAKKPPTDLIEKGGVSEDAGKNNVKYKNKLKKKCMNCFKKLIAKLKRAFCRRRRKNAKEKKKALEKKKKNEKKKSETEGHANGGKKEIENLDDIQPHKAKKAHAKKKKSGGVKSSKVTKPNKRSKKQKPDEVRLEMEENTDSNEAQVRVCIQSTTNSGSEQTQHSNNSKKAKSKAGNEYVEVLPAAKEPSDSGRKQKKVQSPKSSNKAKKPKSSKKVKQDATQLDHVYVNPDASSTSIDTEQGHIYETVA